MRGSSSTRKNPQPEFQNIPLHRIDPDPEQVRQSKHLEAEAFKGFCANIVSQGVQQAVIVRPGERRGRYTLIAGERRYRAAKQAGNATIPCRVVQKQLSRMEIVSLQLSENLQRQELSHMDLARAFAWMTSDDGGGLTAREVAARLGKSEAFISEHRMLLGLSPQDQQQLEAGTLSFDAARAKLRNKPAPGKARGRISKEREGTAAAGAAEASVGAASSPASGQVEARARTIPKRLDNGDYVYQQYAGFHPETSLTILIASPQRAEPDLGTVIRGLEHHLHLLKLRQERERHGREHGKGRENTGQQG